MREGLTITGATGDADVEQYRIQACNSDFAGTVYVYALPGSPRKWADQLSGFPRNSEDRRLLCCGLSDSVLAGGLVELRFACIDTSGHVVLDLVMSTGYDRVSDPEERATFRLKISAAGVDRFVQQLERLTVESDFSAHLPLE